MFEQVAAQLGVRLNPLPGVMSIASAVAENGRAGELGPAHDVIPVLLKWGVVVAILGYPVPARTRVM